MGVLSHSHPINRKNPDSPHIDTFGKPFGTDDHKPLIDNYEWEDDGEIASKPIQHKHRNIDETIEDDTMRIIWRHRPPSRVDAEREIGKRIPVPAAAIDDDDDDDNDGEKDFPV